MQIQKAAVIPNAQRLKIKEGRVERMKMKRMKKIIAFALTLCTVLGLLSGCGSQVQADATNQEEITHLANTASEQTEQAEGKERKLNVSLLQMPIFEDPKDSLEYLRYAVDELMWGTLRPELVVGVENGLGFSPQRLDSEFIEYLGAIAKKYQIYFIPGTFSEISDDLPEGETYNTCPVFGPDGELITVYRKKAPFYPGEECTPGPVDEYCTFEIPEKDITVGVQICYDQFFPENARTLALEGAELIVCPSYDTAEFDFIPDVIPRCRALENELFYIWCNGVGGPCGNSTVVDPEGQVIYKCDSTEMTYTTCLDFAEVTEKRLYGQDQHLNALRYFGLEYPYAGKLEEAPVYDGWPDLTVTVDDYDQRAKEIGINTTPRQIDAQMQAEQDKKMDELIEKIS